MVDPNLVPAVSQQFDVLKHPVCKKESIDHKEKDKGRNEAISKKFRSLPEEQPDTGKVLRKLRLALLVIRNGTEHPKFDFLIPRYEWKNREMLHRKKQKRLRNNVDALKLSQLPDEPV